MVTEGQRNLETVIFDYFGAPREGNQEAVRAVLDPNVTWQGLHEDWVCHGPDEVIETLQEGLRLRRNVAALEFVRAGSRIGDGCPRSLARRGRGRAARRSNLQCLHSEQWKNRPH